MNISCLREELSFVRKIVYNVSAEYMSALKNNFYLSALMSDLNIYIYPTKQQITSGVCIITPMERRIDINVCTDDSQKYVAFIVAHEFGHLLFTNVHDQLHLSGMAMDSSKNLTAIARILPDDSIYGKQLEELISDYLAYYIVNRMNFEDENNKYKQEFEKNSFGYNVIQTLEYPFGRSIIEGDFIDEQYEDENEIRYNTFWNAILSFSFNIIVDDFDQIMGIGEFMKFNKYLEEYYKSQSSKTQKKIKAMLEAFIEKTS